MAEEIDLSQLNEKQKTKEFKVVAKEVKSKDPEVKIKALSKLKNHRYLIEGGCFHSLFESIIAKKKSLENCKLTLDALNSFFGSAEQSQIFSAIQSMYTAQPTLESVSNIFGLINYKEDVKKPNSKSTVITQPPESEVVLNLRAESITILHVITKSILTTKFNQSSPIQPIISEIPEISDSSPSTVPPVITLSQSISLISTAFASLPEFIPVLCSKLTSILEMRSSEDPGMKEAGQKEGVAALSVLLFVLKNSKEATDEFVQNELLARFLTLTLDRALSAPASEVLDWVRAHPLALPILAREENLEILLKSFEEASEQIAQLCSGGLMTFKFRDSVEKEKGKKAPEEKKPPPASTKDKKGASKESVANLAAAAAAEAEIPVVLTILLNSLSKILTQLLASYASTPLGTPPPFQLELTSSLAQRLVTCLGRLCGNSVLWDTSRNLSHKPEYAPPSVPSPAYSSHSPSNPNSRSDTLEHCASLIGLLSLHSPEIRSSVLASGGGWFLLTALQHSAQVYLSQSPAMPSSSTSTSSISSINHSKSSSMSSDERLLHRLRFALEKAFLSVVTLEDESGGNPKPLSVPTDGTSNVRWPIAEGHRIDQTCFSVNSEPPQKDGSLGPGAGTLTLKALLELATSEDSDLAGRGLRLLSLVVLGCDSHSHSHSELPPILSFDVSFVQKVSSILQEKAQSLIRNIPSSTVVGGGEKSVLNSIASKEVLPTTSGSMELVTTNMDMDGNEEYKSESLEAFQLKSLSCDPSDTSTVYLSCTLLELFLSRNNDQFINVFATKERLVLLSELLYQFGPTSVSLSTPEMSVKLFDPRLQCWDISSADTGLAPTEDRNPSSEEMLLREVILSLLTCVASADSTLRTYSGPVPPEPTHPLPSSTSPCAEASASVCRYCGDACVSIALSVVNIQSQDPLDRTINEPTDSDSLILNRELLFTWGDLSSLNINILNNCLRLMNSMASSRTLGLLCVLESIAEAGFTPSQGDSARHGSSHPSSTLSKAGSQVGLGGGGGGGGGSVVDINHMNEKKSSLQYLKNIISASLPAQGLPPFSPTPASQSTHSPKLATGTTISPNPSPSFDLNRHFEWTRPIHFTDVFKPSTSSPSSHFTRFSSLLSNKHHWPYLIFSGCLSGLLCNPHLLTTTSTLCLQALTKAILIPELSPHSQPVVSDALSTMFLSVGGGSVLCKAIGRYGVIDQEMKESEFGLPLLEYLFSRGRARQTFWDEWRDVHEERDPKTGKVLPKKEKKAAPPSKVDPKKAGSSLNLDVRLNFDPEEDFPDPNHGPSEEFWSQLLNISFLDQEPSAGGQSLLTPLNIAIQGRLTSIATLLIDLGVDVNHSDLQGVSPIMFALVLGDEPVLSALLHHKVDLNGVDRDGNPGIKFAFCTLSPEDIEQRLDPQPTSGPNTSPVLTGRNTLLQLVLENSKPDVRMCDAEGNSSLHYLMGIGRVSFRVGSQRFSIQCSPPSNQPTETLHLTQLLLSKHASLNQCNRRGVVPLHIAAARGSMEVIQYFLDSDANPTLLDAEGFLPLHYLAAACPVNLNTFDADRQVGGFTRIPQLSTECFDVLLAASEHRPVTSAVFSDNRSGKTEMEKFMLEVDEILDQMYENIVSSPSLLSYRVPPSQLHVQSSVEGLNLLHLALSGHVLFDRSHIFHPFLSTNKYARIHLALHILKSFSGETVNMLINKSDVFGTTTLHSASLLLLDSTSQLSLTEKELRAKRVRKFPSVEVELLDYLCENLDWGSFSSVSSRPVYHSRNSLPSPWTVLHGALASNNHYLVQRLIKSRVCFVDSFPYVHYLAQCDPAHLSAETCDQLIQATLSSSEPSSLLNFPSTSSSSYLPPPLILAVRNLNLPLIPSLLQTGLIDISFQDPSQGNRTPIHLLSLPRYQSPLRSGDTLGLTNHLKQIQTFRVFLTSLSSSDLSSLDLLIEDEQGETAVDAALRMGVDPQISSEHLINEMILVKPDQVIRRILSPLPPSLASLASTGTWLETLERTDLNLTEKLQAMLQSNENRVIRRSPRPSPRPTIYASSEIEELERTLRRTSSLLQPLLSLCQSSPSPALRSFSHLHPCYSQGLTLQSFLSSQSSIHPVQTHEEESEWQSTLDSNFQFQLKL